MKAKRELQCSIIFSLALDLTYRDLNIKSSRKAPIPNKGTGLALNARHVPAGVGTAYQWTEDRRDQLKRERDRKIFDLWLQCYSQREIAEKLGIALGTVNEVIEVFKNGNIAKMHSPMTLPLMEKNCQMSKFLH